LHLVGILFPHINDDALSKSHQTYLQVSLQVHSNNTFRSFFDHHQVFKELKYAICNCVIIVRNGIPLGFTLFSTMTLKIVKYNVNYLKMWYGRVCIVVDNYSWSH